MTVEREFSDGEVVPGTRYRVISLIGMGGMGSVYEVEHGELGKRFVLKALLQSLADREDLELRLRNEWRALGRLEHPNIVSVTDAGVTTTSIPYFVMERLQGETLASRLRRHRRLEIPEAISVACDVLEGLSAAHHIGIVHRDVKPPNIFLVTGRPAKLLDFGIAKVLDPKASQITGKGLTLGTPRYMAPEQATGAPIDGRTDLYATGLILFEMIAGVGPFDSARDASELFLAHVAEDAPKLSSKNRLVPPALDKVVARLLAKKPADRPSSAAAVATELRQIAESIRRASAPRISMEERTVPGGPFDAIERAETVASQPPGGFDGSGRRVASEAPTRTHVGDAMDTATGRPPSLSVSGHALTVADSPPSSFAPSERSRTMRLDEFDDVPATRTAVPFGQPETPPPVEQGDQVSSRSSRKSGPLVVALAALVAAAALFVAFMVRRDSARVPMGAPSVHAEQSAPSTASRASTEREQLSAASPNAENAASAAPAESAAPLAAASVTLPGQAQVFAPVPRSPNAPPRPSAAAQTVQAVQQVQNREIPSSGLAVPSRVTSQKSSKKRDSAPVKVLPASGL